MKPMVARTQHENAAFEMRFGTYRSLDVAEPRA